MVSVPATVSVFEGDEIVSVCATLSGMVDIERDIVVTFSSSDLIGKMNDNIARILNSL